MLIGSTVLSLVSYLVQLAIFALVVVAFVTALMHPVSDFADKGTKMMWLAILGAGVLLGIDRLFNHIIWFAPGFLKTLVYWACIFAAMYFFGSEHARMSRSGGFTWKAFFDKRDGGANSGNSRGSWG
ncbi:MAG: DUF2516 family protein [Actinomycetaceae bacterium]|nr:DUF2516 family protein [Actinomycetaceae bacterium]